MSANTKKQALNYKQPSEISKSVSAPKSEETNFHIKKLQCGNCT